MTSFGLAIWVFQETGSATQLALIVTASRLPMLVVSPFAGALIDRWDRRLAMLLADTGAALGTLVTMLLLVSGVLETWHLYLTLSLAGLFEAFQFPAYSAATTVLVPKEHYARASGLVQSAGSVGRIVAPTAAAAVVVWSGLTTLFVIDLATYVFAVGTLLVARFPSVERGDRKGRGVSGLLLEAREGLDFVLQRRALLVLMVSFVVVNFAFAFQGVLLIPLLLSITSERAAGLVVSAGAVGMLAGSLALTIWGGPRDRIAGVYVPIAAMGIGLVLIGVRPSLWLLAAGLVLMQITHPTAGGSSQAIWQSKVPPNLQGRVFAIRQLSAIASSPVAFLLAGWLADRIFEPFMATAGGPIGALFGTGPGRGIGLLFVLTGVFVMGVVFVAWNHPRIRSLEAEIPDLEPVPVPA
jgi:MFS family permease